MKLRVICLISLIAVSLAQAFALGVSSGAYPGELFTNSIWFYDAQNASNYCFGYSPDFGRHFVVTLTVPDQFIQGEIHGTEYLGEFYLHDTSGDHLFKFHNFGATFTLENTDFDEIDGIAPGAGPQQLFLYNNTSTGCFVYTSENNGTEYTIVNFFPQVAIKQIAWVREGASLYLLGYHSGESEHRLFRSNDAGQSFYTYVLDTQLQTPGTEDLYYKLLPVQDGTIFLFQHWLSGAEREYRLYQSGNNLENCALVWQYEPLINEYVDLLWTGADQSEFLKQSFFWYMAYNTLQFSVSSADVINFLPTGFYNFQQPYQNTGFLVATPSETTLAPTAGETVIHVRANVDWQITCNADWVNSFSQTSGDSSADVLMSYQANWSEATRSCVLQFSSTNAPDTILTINQSGTVSADDPINPDHTQITAYPNPFRSSTKIKVNRTSSVELEARIYNIRGELVRVLATDQNVPGELYLEWDANDHAGRRVASGVYLCRLKVGNSIYTHKLLCW